MEEEPEVSKGLPTQAGHREFLNTLARKRQGELAELAFTYKAANYGFAVSRPYGDSYRYDFILDSGKRLWRVQVKSTYKKSRRGYRVMASWGAGRSHLAYSPDDIDILVAYLAPESIWYVVPVRAFVPRKVLYFYPNSKDRHAPQERFREAWCLMACRQEGEFTNLDVAAACHLGRQNQSCGVKEGRLREKRCASFPCEQYATSN